MRDRLASLEAELRGTTIPHLEQVADGRSSDFFVTDRFAWFSNGYLRRQKRPIETILDLCEEINTLRTLLDEPPSRAVVSIEGACRESSDRQNPHRLGPRRLAQRVLDELRERAA